MNLAERLFDTILTDFGVFNGGLYLVCVIVALLCGAITAFSASYRTHTSKSFIISLVLLPAIVTTVIIMVNGNIGTGVAVMGAFSLVRFRSVPGKAKDIAAIFLAMTAGLSCAAGYVGIALIFTVIACVVLVALTFIPTKTEKAMELRITVPETLSFYDAFDEIFEKYTTSHTLTKVKTTNMGSLYRLTYRIQPKDKRLCREFIDELRVRNGNLEICLSEETENSEEL